jgi:hypothetical protein
MNTITQDIYCYEDDDTGLIQFDYDVIIREFADKLSQLTGEKVSIAYDVED